MDNKPPLNLRLFERLEWLLPNKYSSDGKTESAWFPLFGTVFFGFLSIILLYNAFNAAVFYQDWEGVLIYGFFGLVLLVGDVSWLIILYQYHESQKGMFKERELEYGVEFSSWDHIFIHRTEQEALEEIASDDKLWDNLFCKHLMQEEIQQLSNRYLHLFDGMPRVQAIAVNEPYDGGRVYPSLAYAMGSDKFVVKKFHYDSASRENLVHTILHEMTHNWIAWKQIKMDDPHGKEFQDKLNLVIHQSQGINPHSFKGRW